MPDPNDQPTQNLETLALYALRTDKATFRRDACKRADFDRVLADELAANPNTGITPLTDEERHFVHGWMYLAELEYLENGQANDGKLKAAILRQLAGGPHDPSNPFHILTG